MNKPFRRKGPDHHGSERRGKDRFGKDRFGKDRRSGGGGSHGDDRRGGKDHGDAGSPPRPPFKGGAGRGTLAWTPRTESSGGRPDSRPPYKKFAKFGKKPPSAAHSPHPPHAPHASGPRGDVARLLASLRQGIDDAPRDSRGRQAFYPLDPEGPLCPLLRRPEMLWQTLYADRAYHREILSLARRFHQIPNDYDTTLEQDRALALRMLDSPRGRRWLAENERPAVLISLHNAIYRRFIQADRQIADPLHDLARSLRAAEVKIGATTRTELDIERWRAVVQMVPNLTRRRAEATALWACAFAMRQPADAARILDPLLEIGGYLFASWIAPDRAGQAADSEEPEEPAEEKLEELEEQGEQEEWEELKKLEGMEGREEEEEDGADPEEMEEEEVEEEAPKAFSDDVASMETIQNHPAAGVLPAPSPTPMPNLAPTPKITPTPAAPATSSVPAPAPVPAPALKPIAPAAAPAGSASPKPPQCRRIDKLSRGGSDALYQTIHISEDEIPEESIASEEGIFLGPEEENGFLESGVADSGSSELEGGGAAPSINCAPTPPPSPKQPAAAAAALPPPPALRALERSSRALQARRRACSNMAADQAGHPTPEGMARLSAEYAALLHARNEFLHEGLSALADILAGASCLDSATRASLESLLRALRESEEEKTTKTPRH